MACQQSPLLANGLPWSETSKDSPTSPTNRKRKGPRSDDATAEGDGDAGTESNGQEDAPAGSAAQMSVFVETPIDDVGIIGSLGYGRNGVVFLANWHGQKVALKQIDVGKDGFEYFDKEVEGYLALEAVWGRLVPTLLFVSDSWAGWIKFIGLQLGRDPLPGDDISEQINVLSTLENDYGFRHDDTDNGNMIFIFDEKTNTERLVAIDLESHTMIDKVLALISTMKSAVSRRNSREIPRHLQAMMMMMTMMMIPMKKTTNLPETRVKVLLSWAFLR
jgi:hypothetical protein